MTQRRELEHHRHSLDEIRGIMNSMKTLAHLETRKLARFLPAQQAVIRDIECIAGDFLGCYPETLPEIPESIPVYLLIGSERGFCGDYNHVLVAHLATVLQGHGGAGEPQLVVVGRKLSGALEHDPRVVARIAGAGVVEEVPDVLQAVVNALTELQQRHGALTLYGLYSHRDEGLVTQQLLPPFRGPLPQAVAHTTPPHLNLAPHRFLSRLIDDYLFAALYGMLYTALTAENHFRVAHLENAVDHLDGESADLKRRCNMLRQEEIIEEIEVILLNAAGPDGSSAGWRR